MEASKNVDSLGEKCAELEVSLAEVDARIAELSASLAGAVPQPARPAWVGDLPRELAEQHAELERQAASLLQARLDTEKQRQQQQDNAQRAAGAAAAPAGALPAQPGAGSGVVAAAAGPEVPEIEMPDADEGLDEALQMAGLDAPAEASPDLKRNLLTGFNAAVRRTRMVRSTPYGG